VNQKIDWKERAERLPVIFPNQGLISDQVVDEVVEGIRVQATHEYYFPDDINIIHVVLPIQPLKMVENITAELIAAFDAPFCITHKSSMTHLFWRSSDQNLPMSGLEERLGTEEVNKVIAKFGIDEQGAKELRNVIRGNESLPRFDLAAKEELIPLISKIPAQRRSKVLMAYQTLSMMYGQARMRQEAHRQMN